MSTLNGSVTLFYLFDIADEIRLDDLRKRLGTPVAGRVPRLRDPAPDYVRFERAPVVESLDAITTTSGDRMSVRLTYFEFGIACIEFDLAFQTGWSELVQLAARWSGSGELEDRAIALLRARLTGAGSELIKPYETWLKEDYAIVQVNDTEPASTALSLITGHGAHIAQIVRGESSKLSAAEQADVIQARMSYYPNDLIVIGWTAAFLFDTVEGAASTIDLLRYANTQLLNFRHYDEVLTRVLAGVYDRLEVKRGFFSRWKLAREAESLNRIRLDIQELTERMDTSIKFLSDMFSARLYKLAAAKIGVPDYRLLVDEKLRTADSLYHSMVDQFNHGRAFAMELMIVIILIIDLIYLFRGKSL